MEIRNLNTTPQSPLVEGKDYYFEQGLMVLTAHYLRQRGYCCANGCRHCPYDKSSGASDDAVTHNTELQNEAGFR